LIDHEFRELQIISKMLPDLLAHSVKGIRLLMPKYWDYWLGFLKKQHNIQGLFSICLLASSSFVSIFLSHKM